jgi:hypothetical protein
MTPPAIFFFAKWGVQADEVGGSNPPDPPVNSSTEVRQLRRPDDVSSSDRAPAERRVALIPYFTQTNVNVQRVV